MANGFILGVDLQIQKVLGLNAVKQQLAGVTVGQGVQQPLKQTQQQIDNIAASASAAQTPLNNAGKAVSNLGQQSARASSSIGKTTPIINQGAKAAENFGDQVFLAGKRYGAFIAATAVAFKGIELVGAGTEAVIGFDEAVIKLSQIIGRTPDQIGDLTQQILDLSVQTGTAAEEIARIARVLSQAGFRGTQLQEAVQQLARVPLAPTFENVDEAIIGVVAALKQFSDEGLSTADVLDKLTAVEREFAASSRDITIGISRGGAAFEAIGGTLDQFIAAFTTIRDVTQESASSVGVALKTISSRLASPAILKFLESRGITLIEEGQFVGPLEAFRRIGEAIENITNVQDRVEIANRLGGRRQLSRLLALINNIDSLNRALEISENSASAFADTTEQGLEAIRIKINQLVANAQKLAIELGPEVFTPFIETLTQAGNSAVELLRVLRPLLPIIAQIGAVFATGGILRAGRSLAGAVLQRSAPFRAAAAAGTAPTVRGFVGQSPFAQAGLLVAAGQATSSLLQLADGADSLVASFVTAFTTLTAAITLFRGQTLTQFFGGGGLLPSLGRLGGAIGTVGAIAAPILISQARTSVEETANRIIESAVETVRGIEIDPNDVSPENQQALRNAFVQLNNTLSQSLSDFVQSFDPFAEDISFGESVSRIFAGIGRGLSGLFGGDSERLFRRGGVSTEDIQRRIGGIIDASDELVNNLLDSFARSISDTDAVDPQALAGRLFRQISEAGISQEAATVLTDRIIEAAGGLEAFTERITESARSVQDQIEATQRLSDLTKQFIAPGLTGELFNFDRAFRRTVSVLESSTESFRNQFSILTGIGAGNIGGDFGTEAIRRSIVGGAFEDVFRELPGIPRFIGGIQDIQNVLEDFITFASQRGDAFTIQNLEDQLDVFFQFRNNVPRAIQENFREVLTQAGRLMADSAGTAVPLEQIRERFSQSLEELGSELSDTVVEQIGRLAELSIARIERNLDAFSNIQRLRLETAVTPGSQANLLRDLFREAGVPFRGIGRGPFEAPGTIEQLRERGRRLGRDITPSAEPGFFIGGASQALIEAVTGGRTREELRRRFLDLTRSVSEARNQLSSLDFGTEQFDSVSQRLQNLSTELIRVQTAFEALNQASSRARQARLQEAEAQGQLRLERFRQTIEQQTARGRPVDAERVRRQIFDIQQETAEEQRRINEEFDRIVEDDARARLEAAVIVERNTRDQKTTTQIFQSSVDRFSQAVNSFSTFSQEPQGQDTASLERFNRLFNQGLLSREEASRFIGRIIGDGGGVNNRQRQEIDRDINESATNNQENQQRLANIADNMNEVASTNIEAVKSIEKLIENLQQPRGSDSVNVQNISELASEFQRLVSGTDRRFLLDTEQRLEIDINGLNERVRDEIEPLLRDAANQAAKSVVLDILRSISNRSNDPESANLFSQLTTELESNG